MDIVTTYPLRPIEIRNNFFLSTLTILSFIEDLTIRMIVDTLISVGTIWNVYPVTMKYTEAVQVPVLGSNALSKPPIDYTIDDMNNPDSKRSRNSICEPLPSSFFFFL